LSDFIKLSHGSGGVEMRELLMKLIVNRVEDKLKRYGEGVGLDVLDDGAAIRVGEKYIVVSTDSYTVKPLFFPGGDLGVLAAAGSINDVLMMGAVPVAMMDSIIVEEGFSISDLERIIESFLRVLKEENIALIGGDFKVMPRGEIDGVVMNTTAIGLADRLIIDKPAPGDKIIVSDYLGDHGAVIMMYRLGLAQKTDILEKSLLRSDVKSLTKLMIPLIERYGKYIHAARDPTRGGLAGVLYEWISETRNIILLREEDIPIREPVRRYSEMLGIDPLYLASEGAAVFSVDPSIADEFVSFIHSLGFKNAKIIGEVKESSRLSGKVILETVAGGLRILDPPRGEIVPRIC